MDQQLADQEPRSPSDIKKRDSWINNSQIKSPDRLQTSRNAILGSTTPRSRTPIAFRHQETRFSDQQLPDQEPRSPSDIKKRDSWINNSQIKSPDRLQTSRNAILGSTTPRSRAPIA